METIALKTARLILLLVFASWVLAIVSALVLTARLTRKHGWRGCLWGALSILGAVLAGGFVSALIGLIESMVITLTIWIRSFTGSLVVELSACFLFAVAGGNCADLHHDLPNFV